MSRLGLKPGDLRLLSSDITYIAQNRFNSRGFETYKLRQQNYDFRLSNEHKNCDCALCSEHRPIFLAIGKPFT